VSKDDDLLDLKLPACLCMTRPVHSRPLSRVRVVVGRDRLGSAVHGYECVGAVESVGALGQCPQVGVGASERALDRPWSSVLWTNSR
jgi:hypothetical protein